jgi:deoxyribose-phosphate aldolase
MEINTYIEHTILKADTVKADIDKICGEAIENQFVGVCIPPYFVKYGKEKLKDSDIKLVTVVGFPLGYQTISTKVEETRKALEDGADEIDMVINVAALKNGDFNHVKDGVESVATLCRLKGKVLKVIIETALLSEEEIIRACEICADIGVDYVKTSTGFNEGAKVEHIKLMRKTLPDKIKIKASGGIRDRKFALQLIKSGADRLGTSSGLKIIQEN